MTTPINTPETSATDAPEQPTDQQPGDPKPTETVEFWKQKAREQENRAKANKTAADELAALKQSQMSEQERLTAQLAEATKAAELARAEALRFRVAASNGISDEDAEIFLTGTDEESIKRQAERLVALRGAAAPKSPRPDPSQGSHNPTPVSGRDAGLAEAQKRFGTKQ